MRFSVRLHDAVDTDTVLRRFLPVLSGERGERRVAFAEYDMATESLVHRWSTAAEGEGEVEDGPVSIEPHRIHSLLADDAGGDRPLRPADGAPAWVLRDLMPGLDPERTWVRTRAISHEGRWLGVLVVATPRRWWMPKKSDESVQAGGDVLELCLGRAYSLRGGAGVYGGISALAVSSSERVRVQEREIQDAREELERCRLRLEAMELAASSATEMLIDAHVELDRRSTRVRRQTRLLYLLRQLLERNAAGLDAPELAAEIVRTVAEAFEGHRCSLLLLDRSSTPPELRVGAAVGFPEAVDHGQVRIPVGRGIAGQVVHSKSGVVVRDDAEAAEQPVVGDEWYTGTAFVSLPLISRGRVLGVL
ncbi:MAG TPA: GAF domain-containing protein, partial [Longimicrobiaceae bacterium]|nr:GAF domain-containing protein [Longimicrobiaceae bacterium]